MLGDEIVNSRQSTDPAFKRGAYISNGGGADGRPSRIRDLLGMMGTAEALRQLAQQDPSVVVLHVGTHDLGQGRALTSKEVGEYEAMLEILHGALSTAVVVVTGLLPRRDLEVRVVGESNEKLERMVGGFNRKCRMEIGRFLVRERGREMLMLQCTTCRHLGSCAAYISTMPSI